MSKIILSLQYYTSAKINPFCNSFVHKCLQFLIGRIFRLYSVLKILIENNNNTLPWGKKVLLNVYICLSAHIVFNAIEN